MPREFEPLRHPASLTAPPCASVVYDFNRPALACYERAGFRLEGQLREDTLVGGEWWSTSLMSILEEEWRARG